MTEQKHIIFSVKCCPTIIIFRHTLYIQNVKVAPGDVSDEANVSCNFVNGTELMGYLGIANGNLQVRYMVAKRRSQGGNQVDNISNLHGQW